MNIITGLSHNPLIASALCAIDKDLSAATRQAALQSPHSFELEKSSTTDRVLVVGWTNPHPLEGMSARALATLTHLNPLILC